MTFKQHLHFIQTQVNFLQLKFEVISKLYYIYAKGPFLHERFT